MIPVAILKTEKNRHRVGVTFSRARKREKRKVSHFHSSRSYRIVKVAARNSPLFTPREEVRKTALLRTSDNDDEPRRLLRDTRGAHIASNNEVASQRRTSSRFSSKYSARSRRDPRTPRQIRVALRDEIQMIISRVRNASRADEESPGASSVQFPRDSARVLRADFRARAGALVAVTKAYSGLTAASRSPRKLLGRHSTAAHLTPMRRILTHTSAGAYGVSPSALHREIVRSRSMRAPSHRIEILEKFPSRE